MNFDERKIEATGLVVEFLADFSPPRGLDESQLASRISHIADAFARRMPVGEKYAEKIHGVFKRVRDTHMSNTWPPQAAFIMAMPQTEFRGISPTTYTPEDKDRIARLMAQGVAVPEREIWRNHNVSRDIIDRYRKASIQNWREVHRQDAMEMMQRKYGQIVDVYFMEAGQ